MTERSNTPPPPLEQSLKYLAWSVKEMNESIKKISDCLEIYLKKSEDQISKSPFIGKVKADSYKDQDLPF